MIEPTPRQVQDYGYLDETSPNFIQSVRGVRNGRLNLTFLNIPFVKQALHCFEIENIEEHFLMAPPPA